MTSDRTPVKRPVRTIVWKLCVFGAAVALIVGKQSARANQGSYELAAEAASSFLAPLTAEGPLVRTAGWPFFHSTRRAHWDAHCYPATPHPAVARIIVPESGATAFGSGTLVDVRDQYGVVVTNWHVVRDSQGTVEVTFPNGFRSHARPLKVDSDWDLAALVIWRPPIEPVKMATQPPRPGDVLTIHGYGQGQYRIATGRCTAYYAPRMNYPQEMLELDVEARQGDSGGPIFNDRGELAGVLFGAGQGTTLGSFAPRVSHFLATLAPDIGQTEDTAAIATADRPAPEVRARNSDWVTAVANYPSSPWSPPKAADTGGPHAPTTSGRPAEIAGATSTPTAAIVPLSWSDLANTGWYEPLKAALALVGLLAIAGRLVKVVR